MIVVYGVCGGGRSQVLCARGGQRTALAISPHCLPCLRQASVLLNCVYARLTGPQASSLSISLLAIGALGPATAVCSGVVGSEDSSSAP